MDHGIRRAHVLRGVTKICSRHSTTFLERGFRLPKMSVVTGKSGRAVCSSCACRKREGQTHVDIRSISWQLRCPQTRSCVWVHHILAGKGVRVRSNRRARLRAGLTCDGDLFALGNVPERIHLHAPTTGHKEDSALSCLMRGCMLMIRILRITHNY